MLSSVQSENENSASRVALHFSCCFVSCFFCGGGRVGGKGQFRGGLSSMMFPAARAV